ncbi:MAG TPA: hypothetical protein VJ577_13230 [Burkholderiaceae bacterium]|nr:hypothetical protein [Burkholderiaceae bacterium]
MFSRKYFCCICAAAWISSGCTVVSVATTAVSAGATVVGVGVSAGTAVVGATATVAKGVVGGGS